MSRPDETPLRLHIGGSSRKRWRLADSDNGDAVFTMLPGDDIVLRIVGPDKAELLRHAMSTGEIVGLPAAGPFQEIEWWQGASASRPIVPNSRYEIEYRRGYDQIPLWFGPVILSEGANDD